MPAMGALVIVGVPSVVSELGKAVVPLAVVGVALSTGSLTWALLGVSPGGSEDSTLLVDAAMFGIDAAFTGGALGNKLLFLNTLVASSWTTVAVLAALGRVTALPTSFPSPFF